MQEQNESAKNERIESLTVLTAGPAKLRTEMFPVVRKSLEHIERLCEEIWGAEMKAPVPT